jgi:hypothetical protein
MTQEIVDELLEEAVAFCHDFYTTSVCMPPQCKFQRDTGEGIVVVFPYGDDDEKHAAILALKSLLLVHKAINYTVITEAWVTRHRTMTEALAAPRAGNSPNRIEMVMVFVVERDGPRTSAIFRIERGEDDKVENLLPMPGELQNSIFFELFIGDEP